MKLVLGKIAPVAVLVATSAAAAEPVVVAIVAAALPGATKPLVRDPRTLVSLCKRPDSSGRFAFAADALLQPPAADRWLAPCASTPLLPHDSVGMNVATPSPAEQSEHFISLLKKFSTAMLVTHTGEDNFHARPMAIAQIEDDGRLWFFTGADSAKVHEIELDSHVHITAQDGRSAFLTLTGRAALLGDREKIAQLWSEPFKVWFPQGKDDPNIELICVRPERGEFWDTTGVKGVKYIWEATKAYFSGTIPDVHDGEMHGKVRL